MVSFRSRCGSRVSQEMWLSSPVSSESMNYSFESPKVFDKLLIPEDSELRKPIVISNPLGEDFSVMRTTAPERHAYFPGYQL